MGIGTSDGKYYDDETDYVFDQFSKGQQQNFETKLSKDEESKYQDWKSIHAPNDSGFDYDFRGAFKAGVTPDNESNHWPDTFKKPNHPTFSDQSQYAKDAPHLAGSWNGDTYIPPASAGPKAPGSASAAQDLSDMSEVAARPRDPSVDSFIDRYGVWNIHDKLKKDEEDERIDMEINREGKAKYIRPGSKKWMGGVISDATPDPVRAGQQYAADFSGRGSDMEGPYQHQLPYSEQHRQNLLERAPVAKAGDPSFNEGDKNFRRGNIQGMLDETQEEIDKRHQQFVKEWNDSPNTKKIDPKTSKPHEAGIVRIGKHAKGVEEFLRDLPEDVEAFDMNDGTVVLKKKAALTS